MYKQAALICCTLTMTGCVSTMLASKPTEAHLRPDTATKAEGTIPNVVSQAIPLPPPRPKGKTETYSVVVNNVNVHDLLFALARDAKVNVDIHPGISGNITLNAIDQTLPQLLTRISKQVDMRFELDGDNLAVMPDTPYLKSYQIDYVNMSRNMTGTVATNTQISTSALSGNNNAQGNNTSRIQIENVSNNAFWASLEKNIKEILQDTDKERIITHRLTDIRAEENKAKTSLSQPAPAKKTNATPTNAPLPAPEPQPAVSNAENNAQGSREYRDYETIFASSVIINAETGVISVRANSRQHEKVKEFIERVTSNARKQVLIEATIVEVSLSDGYQQGIDWSRVAGSAAFGIAKPTTTTNTTNAVTPYVISYDKTGSGTLSSTIELLRSFGNIRVLSSPKLSVLNNQTATLKVTEDYVYFNVKSDTTTTANVGTTVGVTTTPQSVSVGFFMSITAQIADDGMVTLNVRPSISSISELKKDPNPIIPTSIPNYIPQIKTREIESLMRIGSGDIAVLGGLMEDRLNNTNYRIPVLGDIPVVGELFNTRENATTKAELVILLRPTIIKDASLNGDYQALKNVLPSDTFFSSDALYQPFGAKSDSGAKAP